MQPRFFLITLMSITVLSMIGSQRVSASEIKLCTDLFMSQNEPPKLLFSSTIYSPTIFHNGKAIIAEDQLLNETVDIQTGRMTTTLKAQEEPYTDDYIGFLPTPAYVEGAVLNYRFAWGLETFVNGFSSRSTLEERASIRANDERMFYHFLNSHRLGYAIVAKPGASKNNPYAAYTRVYDGTDYSRLGIVSHSKNQTAQVYHMPTEISFVRNNIKTDVFENLRNQGYQIFQIGKYVFDETLSPRERDAARIEIYKWLLRNYLDPSKMVSDKVMFMINVDSRGHERAYRHLFGTIKVDGHLFDPPITEPDAILLVDMNTLRTHLEKIIKDSSAN